MILVLHGAYAKDSLYDTVQKSKSFGQSANYFSKILGNSLPLIPSTNSEERIFPECSCPVFSRHLVQRLIGRHSRTNSFLEREVDTRHSVKHCHRLWTTESMEIGSQEDRGNEGKEF